MKTTLAYTCSLALAIAVLYHLHEYQLQPATSNNIISVQANENFSNAAAYHILAPFANELQSHNPANGMNIHYRTDGFRIDNMEQNDEAWEINMQVEGLFRDDNKVISLQQQHTYQIDENELTYHHTDFDIQYINTKAGMRQNFIVFEKPEGSGPLSVQMKVSSEQLSFTCSDNTLSAKQGTKVKYHYNDLHVWDANHQKLEASMELNGDMLALVVDDANAVYPVTIDPVSVTPATFIDDATSGRHDEISEAGDINGDGYGDVLVEMEGVDIALVYYGSAAGLILTPDTLDEDESNAEYAQSISAAGDVNNDGYDDVIVGAYGWDGTFTNQGRAFIYLGSASGLNTTASQFLESNQSTAYFGYSVSGAGDVNNDGYDDVIVGEYSYDNGESNEGRAYVFHGNASGVSTTASSIMEANQASAAFGWDVSGAGDVNNDGYDDVVVGAKDYDNGQTNEGRVYVYHGSASGINTVAVVSLEVNVTFVNLGTEVSNAGDVNNDGYDDILLSAPNYNDADDEGRGYIHYGSAIGITSGSFTVLDVNMFNSNFGWCSANAGDVNNDGYDDVIVGAPYNFGDPISYSGEFYVFEGGPTGISALPNHPINIAQDDAQFGLNVSGCGDVNGDGFDDVMVTAGGYDNGGPGYGLLVVYNGYSCTESAEYVDADNDGFGNMLYGYKSCSVTPGHAPNNTDCNDADVLMNPLTVWYKDLDDDMFYSGTGTPITQCASPGTQYSYGDVGPGDCNDNNNFIYPTCVEYIDGIDNNCVGGIDEGLDWTYGGVLQNNLAQSHLGATDGVGDVNGDGYDDVVAGAYGFKNVQTSEGKVYFYYGSAIGVPATADASIESDQANAWLGYAVSGAGDVNGDGYNDVIAGAPNYDNGQTDEGAAFIYYGSATGINTGAPVMLESNQITAFFGWAVSEAGDVNNDGYDDVVVGAKLYDNGQTDEGAAFLFLGSVAGINTTATAILECNQFSAQFGIAVSGAGDVNNDGYDDIVVGANFYDNGQTNEGRAYVFHGNASGINTTPSVTLECNIDAAEFGFAVSGAGDVNADGYDEIIIGAWQFENDIVDQGIALLYYGSPMGTMPVAYWATIGTMGEFMGYSVAGNMDINGDGYSDVVVGAKDFTDRHTDEGRALVFTGSASGLSMTPIQTMETNVASFYGGTYVAGAGDLDGNGADDVLMGAPDYKLVQTNEGGVYVFYHVGCSDIFYADTDNDGYGNASVTITACAPPVGYVADATDCNDGNDDIHPGGTEICNALDDDCDALTDEGVVETISILAGGATTFCEGGAVNLTATYSGASVQWKKNGADIAGATSAVYAVTKSGTYTCVTTSACGSTTSNSIAVTVNKNPAASISAGGSTTFCAGGSVTLTEVAVAGSTYQWYKGASAIAGATTTSYVATTAGNYKCRVTKTATGCYKNSNAITVTVPCREGDSPLGGAGGLLTIYPNPNNGIFSVSASLREINGASIEIYNTVGQLIYSEQIEPGTEVNETIDLGNCPSGIYFVRVGYGNNYAEQKLIIE